MKLSSLRFLLANDAGDSKTTIADLLASEFKLRGLIEQVLVVCTENIGFQ